MRVLLLSLYEMGRQPFGLASPAAWLREAGHDVCVQDLSRERLSADEARAADLIACHLPMHTATRMAPPVLRKAHALNPRAHLCAYGLYAPLNASHLRACGAQTILGAEFEADLVALADRLQADASPPAPLVETVQNDALQNDALHADTAQADTPRADRPLVETANSDTLQVDAMQVDTLQVATLHVDALNADALHADTSSATPARPAPAMPAGPLPRLAFRVPDRRGLPPLERYARVQVAGESRTTGYTEATRGCKHLCRHCPIVPVYGGRFRAVPADIVLADIAQQVEAGARHITFGDPDFFNGPTHAHAIVTRLAAAHPGLTYDVTIKIEHLLAQRQLLPALRETGCLFVTSAVESTDDVVLRHLAKGHTRADFVEAAGLCRAHGLHLVPTFVAFTPWTTAEAYWDLLQTVRALGLVPNVSPVQWTIRLLIPDGSRLLELDEVRGMVGAFDRTQLVYPWTHVDPRIDALQQRLATLAGRVQGAAPVRDRVDIFGDIEASTRDLLARPDLVGQTPPPLVRATVPYLDEPWYC